MARKTRAVTVKPATHEDEPLNGGDPLIQVQDELRKTRALLRSADRRLELAFLLVEKVRREKAAP